MTLQHAQGIPWVMVPTAPHVAYAVTQDQMGQMWIQLTCYGCGDYTKKPCMDPQNRLGHWVGWYAAMHHGCAR